jgi:hypothetical protein
MSDLPSNEQKPHPEGAELQDRRLFLQGMGKWSGAAIAAVAGTMIGTTVDARAGWLNGVLRGKTSWINRRCGGGGGWINGSGGGGSWVNRSGGGSWVNRGGGGWINRR